MNVRVLICFEAPGDAEFAAMRSLARSLTNNPNSIRVFADKTPRWLVAEFTMPTEAQYKAVPKIDRAIRDWAGNRTDSAIGFPKSEAERERVRRKGQRRRARKQAKKAAPEEGEAT